MDRIRSQAYSQDLRSRVLAASDRGLSARAVAASFDASVSYVLRARQRRERTDAMTALKAQQVRVRKLAAPGDALRAKVASQTDLTLAELRSWLLNAEIFRFYVDEMLTPTLVLGDVVVMDNLPAHKGAAIRELIGARDATLLYLPAYSPDLNPIELMFAKLKHLVRSAAARSVDRLWTVLSDCLRRFTPDECARYLRHCGYEHPV